MVMARAAFFRCQPNARRLGSSAQYADDQKYHCTEDRLMQQPSSCSLDHNTSLTSRQRMSRQREVIGRFPFKRLVNKTTSPYVSLNNKESSRLPVWLKLLSLLTLALVGAPTVASAHAARRTDDWLGICGGECERRSERGSGHFRAKSFLRGLQPHSRRRLVPRVVLVVREWCIAVRRAVRSPPLTPVMPPRHSTHDERAFAFLESQLPPRLHCYSGLERPPKRNLAARGVGLFGPA